MNKRALSIVGVAGLMMVWLSIAFTVLADNEVPSAQPVAPEQAPQTDQQARRRSQLPSVSSSSAKFRPPPRRASRPGSSWPSRFNKSFCLSSRAAATQAPRLILLAAR